MAWLLGSSNRISRVGDGYVAAPQPFDEQDTYGARRSADERSFGNYLQTNQEKRWLGGGLVLVRRTKPEQGSIIGACYRHVFP